MKRMKLLLIGASVRNCADQKLIVDNVVENIQII